MSFTPAWSPPPSRRLSLGLAMAVAALLHLLVIALFLHAHMPRQAPLPAPLPILQIDLTPRPDERPPERPDRVAEANQRAEETRAPEAEPLAAPPPTPPTSTPEEAPSAPPSAPKAMHLKPKPIPNKAEDVRPKPAQSQPAQTAPPQTLAERSLQMNRLRTDILEQSLRDEIAARSTVLTANTTYGPEAAYLRAWVEKVERIGNLNFPDEARRKRLSGRLILEVNLDDRGQVQAMRVRQSSGEPVLDAAAQDIVRLAAPFAPFPAELRMKYDQLTIIRTWVFDAGRGLDTR